MGEIQIAVHFVSTDFNLLYFIIGRVFHYQDRIFRITRHFSYYKITHTPILLHILTIGGY